MVMNLHLPLALTTLLLFSQCKQDDQASTPTPGKDYREEVPSGAYVERSEKMDFFLDTLATDLGIPWGMTFLDQDRILISDKAGKLFLVNRKDDTKEEIQGLPAIEQIGQGGLLDLLAHPDYDQNGWIYLAYSTSTTGGFGTAVSRAKLNGNQLINLEQVFKTDPGAGGGAHFGCRLHIRDGYLFLTLGDRYNMNQAQNLGNHLGTVIRVHEDGKVPTDNPFVSNGNAKPEIWSYGHRNPQGLAWNPFTQELWAHEHGPKGGDEINIIKKGANYGWPLASFGIDYNGDTITQDTALAGMENPIHYWVPSIAPCGMTFLNSDVYPQWKGNLFIGALAGAALHRLELSGQTVNSEEALLKGLSRVRNITQGPDGFLYVAMENPGTVCRIVPAK